MVGRLNLVNVCDDDPLNMSCKAERTIDSPDSGLPASPSPSAWLQSACGDKGSISPASEDECRGSLVPIVPFKSVKQLHPLSYGEGIELDPLPAKEIRYTSSVRYNSERRFVHSVDLQPRALALQHCSQTVLALPHNTWRRYKTQLEFQPRQRPQRFQSTTIVYPKRARTLFTTELSYDSHRLARRFLSSVELQVSEHSRIPQ